jgi:hypothetical protein
MMSEERREPAGGDHHPAKAELQRFISGELASTETRAVVRHLLRGCAVCNRETRILWDFGEEPQQAAPAESRRSVRETGIWR